MILYFLEMFQWIQKYFCILNQEIRSFIFKEYPNRFLYLHTFLRKIPWKLFDPFITFKLQMWRMNYLYISKYFSNFLWSIFENITGMPLRGHLLAARLLCHSNACGLDVLIIIKRSPKFRSEPVWFPFLVCF